jgi:hypothetical protein
MMDEAVTAASHFQQQSGVAAVEKTETQNQYALNELRALLFIELRNTFTTNDELTTAGLI